MNVEQQINGQSSAILSLAFEDLGCLFYPDDSLRGKELGLKIKTAAIAGEFATSIPDKKHAFISDLAAWPACPPIPASSPLRYWLPFMPSEASEEPVLSSDETSQAAAPAAKNKGSASLEGAPWKATANNLAIQIISRQAKKDLYPSRIDIADEIARTFRQSVPKVVGVSGKPLTGETIKRHAFKGITSATKKAQSTKNYRGK